MLPPWFSAILPDGPARLEGDKDAAPGRRLDHNLSRGLQSFVGVLFLILTLFLYPKSLRFKKGYVIWLKHENCNLLIAEVNSPDIIMIIMMKDSSNDGRWYIRRRKLADSIRILSQIFVSVIIF